MRSTPSPATAARSRWWRTPTAGVPTTQASAGRDDVSHLVYVTAFQLDVGESLLGALGGQAPPWILVDQDTGTSWVAGPVDVFYADVEPAAAAASVADLRTQTLSSLTGELTGPGWHDIASTYVLCTQDQAIPLEAQQQMSQRAGQVVSLDSSHSPMLSHTSEPADIVATAAGS